MSLTREGFVTRSGCILHLPDRFSRGQKRGALDRMPENIRGHVEKIAKEIGETWSVSKALF
jgi:hypothetical protein